MRYMMLIYTKETETTMPEEMQAVSDAHWAIMDETTRRGILCGVDPLERTARATTVRMQDGKVVVTDGPFAETKEQLAGYYILECRDRDEALEWAARMIPGSSCGGAPGCVEVRPIREIRKPEPQVKPSEYAKA
jgi:hypothetical protein